MGPADTSCIRHRLCPQCGCSGQVILQARASKSLHPLPQGFLQSLGSPLRSNSGTFPKLEVGHPWDPSTSEGWEAWMKARAPLLPWGNSEARSAGLLAGTPVGWSHGCPRQELHTKAHTGPALLPASPCPHPHSCILGIPAKLLSQAVL